VYGEFALQDKDVEGNGDFEERTQFLGRGTAEVARAQEGGAEVLLRWSGFFHPVECSFEQRE